MAALKDPLRTSFSEAGVSVARHVTTWACGQISQSSSITFPFTTSPSPHPLHYRHPFNVPIFSTAHEGLLAAISVDTETHTEHIYQQTSYEGVWEFKYSLLTLCRTGSGPERVQSSKDRCAIRLRISEHFLHQTYEVSSSSISSKLQCVPLFPES